MLTSAIAPMFCRLRHAAAGPFAVCISGSIDRSTILQAVNVGKALFLTLKKALEQGLIGDNSDFLGKVCLKWKDSEFERQVRSVSLIPRGDAIHAQATVSNRSAVEGAVLEQLRSQQTPREELILCLVT